MLTTRRVGFGVTLALWAMVSQGGLNPADPGLPTAAAFGRTYPNNEASSMCVDCHTASPKPAAGTHFVAHFDSSTVRTTQNTGWEATTAWPSAALSKYAAPSPPAAGSLSVTGQTGELICESCHNLLKNVVGGNNLVAQYLLDPSELCEGCHAVQAAGPPGHHPMTGDTVGPDAENPANHTLNTSHVSHLRGTPTAGSGVAYPGNNEVTCATCHLLHDGQPQTAARVLRRGFSAVTGISGVAGGPVNVVYYAGIPSTYNPGDVVEWATGDGVRGIDRQTDVAAAFPGWRLVQNADPLCDACHLTNDP